MSNLSTELSPLEKINEKNVKTIGSTINKLLRFLPKLSEDLRVYNPTISRNTKVSLSIKIVQYLVRLDFIFISINPFTSIRETSKVHYKLPIEVEVKDGADIDNLSIPLDLVELQKTTDLIGYVIKVIKSVPEIDTLHVYTLARFAERFTVNYLRCLPDTSH